MFNELGRQLAGFGIRFGVIFGAEGYARRQWVIDPKDFRFEHRFLQGKVAEDGLGSQTGSFGYRGLLRALLRSRPDVLMVAGFSPSAMKVWLAALLLRRPYIIWSGEVEQPGRAPLTFPKRWLRRMLIRSASAFIAYGTAAKSHLESLGAPRSAVHIAINTVDTRFFREQARSARNPERVGSDILYVGDLIRGKRLDLLLRACAALAQRGRNFNLVLVGDGPDRPALEQLSTSLGIREQVHFEGYRQKPEIPGYLARAACFAFPSNIDVWGLVLVEAMAAGVPCVASIHSGATVDLIEEGENGFSVNFANVNVVADCLQWILEHPQEARRMGDSAAAFIAERVSPAVSAAGAVAAIRSCLHHP